MPVADSIGALLLAQAEARPDQPFLQTFDREWSYADFAEAVLRVAGGLGNLGLQKGDVVGVWAPNRPEFLLTWFAAAIRGIVLNPINPVLTADEAAYIFADSGARIVVHGGVAEEAVKALKAKCPEIQHTISMEPGPLSFDDLANASPSAPVAVDGSDLSMLIYTSGTTGRPKGVMLEHRHSLSDAAAYAEVVPIGPGEGALTVLPLFHVNAQLVTTLVPLVVGGRTILAPRFSINDFWPHVMRFGPVYVSVVPTILSFLLETADQTGVPDHTSLRAVVVGAAPLSVDLFERFERRFGLHLIEGYGLSECACVASANPFYGPRKIGSIGLPIRGQEMAVVDGAGRPVAATHGTGEIVIRGPNVMRGYWRNPGATGEALQNGWLHTGDVGYVDSDGYYFIVDRKKDMIIRGGENIYPREVEDVLHTHPAVLEAAVVGVPDPIWGEQPVAFVVRRHAVDERELAEWLQARIASFKRPSRFLFVEELPKTPTGKVQKQPLRDSFHEMSPDRRGD